MNRLHVFKSEVLEPRGWYLQTPDALFHEVSFMDAVRSLNKLITADLVARSMTFLRDRGWRVS